MKINVDKLKIAMAEKCLTNQGLCEKAKISLTTLATIKANKRETQSITVGKIARALDITVAELIEE